MATLGVATFLGARLGAWPPHEDETLALFVANQPFGDMVHTVLGERGGAPLHFLLVHLVGLISPSLTALRLLSVAFAVLSIPAVALLLRRLVGRHRALIATALVAASWVTLFHGIYGRMYSLLLFLSAVSFLALLRALERRRTGDWALWALTMLLTVTCHQYGVFLLAIHVIYALLVRRRETFSLRAPAIGLAAVLVLAAPAWRASLVLASRFEVGIGGGGTRLGGPWPVLEYLRNALGDFVAGWLVLFALVAALAAWGLVQLARQRSRAALLAGLTFAIPTAGLMLARVGGSVSAPETRHLIFALPFFAMLVAVGMADLAERAGPRAQPATVLAVTGLVAAELAWGWSQTPTLYAGEPAKRREARAAAAVWLAETSRPSDVLFGYDPLFLAARQRGAQLGDVIVPRADPKLALDTLLDVGSTLGRGVWVLDASDGSRIVNNNSRRLTIQVRTPGPGFQAKAFGPFLIVRTTGPTVTPAEYLRDTALVQRMGYYSLGVPSAPLNYNTAIVALSRLEQGSTGS